MPATRPALLAALATLLFAFSLSLLLASAVGGAEPRSERRSDPAAQKTPPPGAEPTGRRAAEEPKADERKATPRRKTAPSFDRGGFQKSARDPVRELQGRLGALQQRVAELEAQVAALQEAAPDTGLADRLDALEEALQIGSGGDVTLRSAGKVSIEASTLDLDASAIKAQTGMATFNGVLNVQTLNAHTVVAEEMTPAAGNIW